MSNKKNKKRGKFILLEGISGCGKSTLAKRLVSYLVERGVEVVLNAEPTKTSSFGKTVRAVIEGNEVSSEDLLKLKTDTMFLEVMCGSTVDIKKFCGILDRVPRKLLIGKELTELERQALFIADRFTDIVETIIPALDAGKWVVQDRYDLSNFAYGSAHGVALAELSRWHDIVLEDEYIIPDITFLIDIGPAEAVERLKKSGKPIDLHEGLESLTAIRNEYDVVIKAQASLADEGKEAHSVVILDGDQPVHEVFEDMKGKLIKYHILKK
ncbi:MAG: hypothetical protein NTZ36_02815 [Candidatus Jorgensenbacteria bacterium]|nr:hypothetical protein [Candidatus Jorgensenbacteria bacterium]